jgi:glycosyltransferase involved in cell wall biosynthesis
MYQLSVVIPTRNRPGTAAETVRLAAAAGSVSEVEVIVQDCSDDAVLGTVLADAGLIPRVKYLHTSETLSMPENWNRGIARAHGEYVTVIGDDDSVSLDILAVVRWAQAHDLDAVRGADRAQFWYPDIGDEALAGTMVMPRFTGQTTILDAAPRLLEATSTGDHYHLLPTIYHNIVRRSVLERIYQKSGGYVRGSSPDIYSAFAIACEIDRYGVVDYPVVLVGASAPSNTNRGRLGTHQTHFHQFPNYEFTWIAPDSLELVASNFDNMVRAFESLGRQDLIGVVDYRRVYARTIVAEPRRATKHLRKFLRVCRRLGVNRPVAVAGLMAAIVVKVLLNAGRRLLEVRSRKMPDHREVLREIASLPAAIARQSQWLAEHGVKPPGGHF